MSSPSETSAGLRRRRVLTIAVLTAGYAGYYLCRSNLSVSLPLIVDELVADGWSRAEATVRMGGIVSLGVLSYALGKLVGGVLADRYGGRSAFLGGMLGSVVMTVAFAAAGTVPLFTLAWVANRAVQSLGWSGIVQIASRWFSPARYGGVMAVVSLSYLFGDAVARAGLAQLLALGLGWREVFVAAAVALSCLFVLAALTLRDAHEGESPAPRVATRRAVDVRVPPRVDSAPGWSGLGSSLLPLLRHPGFRLVCALSVLLTLLREALNTWIPVYLHDALGLSPQAAARASALFPLFGGIAVLAAGWLADLFGPRGRAGIIALGLAGAAVAMALLAGAGADATRALALLSATACLLLAPYSYLAGAIALDFGGRSSSGSAAGAIDGLGYLGAVLAGDSVARLSVAFGWPTTFLCFAGVAASGCVLALAYLRAVPRATAAMGE